MAKPITISNSISQIGRKWKRHIPKEEVLEAMFESDKTNYTELLYKYYERQKNNQTRD